MDPARRHVSLMVVPLAVIAASMVAAVLVPYGFPLKWMTVTVPIEEMSPFLVINIGAGLLAASIVIAKRRAAAPGTLATVIAVLAILAGTVMTVWAVKVFSEGGYWTHVLVFTAPVAVSLVLAFNAFRARGWERMLVLLGAFAISALPYSCPLVPGMFNLFSGGLVYLTAVVTLLALFVRGMIAARG